MRKMWQYYLLILFFVNFDCTKLYSQEDGDFELIKKEGPIAIYERWITYPKSDPPVRAREVKGEFTFNNTIFAALDLIKDETKIKQWQHHVSEFKVYLNPDTTTWLEYSYHDIPWPVSDQDHFLEYKLHEIVPRKELFITFETKKNYTLAPLRDGVTRMRLSGSWTLKQLNDHQTMATYRILSMPLNFPKFLTDPIIRGNLITTIKEFILIMENARE